jgi:hypothetical protein
MKKTFTLVAVTTLLCSHFAFAQDPNTDINETSGFAVGIKAGTTGIGIEGIYTINEYFALRGHYSKYSDSFEESSDDIDFNLDADIGMAGLLVDVHPFGGFFRLSLGLMSNGNEFSGLAIPTDTFEIGDGEYTPEEIGELSASLTFKSTVPYVGFGWGKTTKEGLGLNFEIGAMLQDTPQISLTTTSSVPGLQEDLIAEEEEFKESVKDFKFWPVVALGITYRF